ncbi:MAG: hypothetical protein LIP01_06365 [Tannerellaceae bacterium]|nr:hypothetical protein [Tannerellaceae bacterium]
MTLDEKVGQMCELAIDAIQLRANPFAGINPANMQVTDIENILKNITFKRNSN